MMFHVGIILVAFKVLVEDPGAYGLPEMLSVALLREIS